MNHIRLQEKAGFTFSPLGDSAIIVKFGEQIDRDTHRRVKTLADFLEKHPFPGLVEYVPAFTTVAVFYDPIEVRRRWKEIGEAGCSLENPRSPYEIVRSVLQRILSGLEETKGDTPRTIEIPVCYGGDFGPDLEFVAAHNHLRPEEVIEIHAGGEYLVHMIGFMPGFPYLGGLSERISAPRRPTPRLSIPAGSVGIAGRQTGVYPMESPGGWQLIGRTPLPLFRPDENPPSLLQTGDIVRFKPISREEYEAYKERAGWR
ncbi:5-oxoprolinase subunit B [Bacillaceae bacterium]